MKNAAPPIFLSNSPAFCLCTVFAGLAITSHLLYSFINAFILIFIVVAGKRFVHVLAHTLGQILYMGSLSVLCLLSALIPFLLAYLLNIELIQPELGLSSLLLGFSWILAYIEDSDPRKMSSSFLQGFLTIFVFFVLFSILVAIKQIFGYGMTQLSQTEFIQSISSHYWLSFSGSFLLSGLLLMILQKLELRIWRYLQKV